MVCCTYLSGKEYTSALSDPELQIMLEELRDATKRDWRLQEKTVQRGHLWWKSEEKLYSVYCGIGHGEFQVMNFYKPSAFMPYVSAETVAAFMNAYRAGMEF